MSEAASPLLIDGHIVTALRNLDKVVIAAVNGVAAGIGAFAQKRAPQWKGE